MGQTTIYDIGGLPVAFPGMIADIGNATVDSMVNAEASASIPIGTVVKQGTSDNDAKLPSAVSSVLVGIVTHSHEYPVVFGGFTQGLSLTAGLAPKCGMNVMRKGRCWAVVEVAVTKGARAFVRHTANGAGKLQPGALLLDDDSGNAIDATGQITFLSTQATPGGLAEIEVDFTNPRSNVQIDV